MLYAADGSGGGPSAVFVHGFRYSAESWAPVGDRLATASLSAWYLDLPGCGRSSTPPTWKGCTIEAYAKCVAQFCAALGLTAVVLVGHSLGGGVALQVAVGWSRWDRGRYPGRQSEP
ncbi:MAG: alpha/beta fold hydrolase [Actinobacteria bacterium]|nr:MAG: alpha/beta fold hydrolase [Actinomycetota bacterium]